MENIPFRMLCILNKEDSATEKKSLFGWG